VWTQYEVTAQIPADANLIRFGVFLNGGGQLEFRHPELMPHPPEDDPDSDLCAESRDMKTVIDYTKAHAAE
jgi:hypothetical protein